jgi:hypothetical protein
MLRGDQKVLPPGLPNCLKKRRLLNEKELSPELCREYGEKFLALGWLEDALEFFQRGNEAAALEKIKAICLKTGDAYLLGRLGGQEPALWRQVAQQALDLGKFLFALRALKLAGDEARAAEVAALLEVESPKH